MGRSRSRSRSRSSGSYSSSEDEEARQEREERRREEREEREHKRQQRRTAKKQQRLEEAVLEKAGTLMWRFSVPSPENVHEEDPFIISLRGKMPSTMKCADASTWDGEMGLELHLRAQFEVQDSIKILLKGKLVLDGEPRLFFRASCAATLGTAWMQLVSLGQVLLDATEAYVEVSVCARGMGVKLKGKSMPRTHNQTKAEETFKEFKRTIYGVERLAGNGNGMQYAEEGEAKGTWTEASSDFMRRERAALIKFHATRGLAATVMGSPDYHPNPCVLICPFGSCRCATRPSPSPLPTLLEPCPLLMLWLLCSSKGHRHLNSFSAVSQLYSHWQKKHSDNQAATVLAARWRLANELTEHGKRQLLNLKVP